MVRVTHSGRYIVGEAGIIWDAENVVCGPSYDIHTNQPANLTDSLTWGNEDLYGCTVEELI